MEDTNTKVKVQVYSVQIDFCGRKSYCKHFRGLRMAALTRCFIATKKYNFHPRVQDRIGVLAKRRNTITTILNLNGQQHTFMTHSPLRKVVEIKEESRPRSFSDSEALLDSILAEPM